LREKEETNAKRSWIIGSLDIVEKLISEKRHETVQFVAGVQHTFLSRMGLDWKTLHVPREKKERESLDVK
jgi:hypothetical protein